jgi:hypothetical protein
MAPAQAPPRRPFCGQHLARPCQLPYVRASPCTPSHACSRASALGRDTSTAAAPTSPRTPRRQPRRDGLHPRFCDPSSPATQGGFLGVIPFWTVAQAPWSFAAGEVIPRRRFSPGHFVKHLGSLLKHGVCFVHRGPHAGVVVANPPGSAAAKPFPSRPHAGLHRAEPHGLPPDRLRQPMGAEPRAGLQVAKPHPIRGSRVAGSV